MPESPVTVVLNHQDWWVYINTWEASKTVLAKSFIVGEDSPIPRIFDRITPPPPPRAPTKINIPLSWG